MSALDHALRFAARGWRVIWAPRGMKRPVVDDWQHRATTDTATITGWWGQRLDANVCVVTGPASGVFVLDVDDKEGKIGSRSLTELEDEFGALPDTYTVGTGSGGVHLYFSYEGIDFDLKNSAGITGALGKKDLDIRARGGQVVAPPSRVDHPSHFHPYLVLFDSPPVAMPTAWIDALRPDTEGADPERRHDPCGARRDLTGLVRTVLEAPEGSRNSCLYWAACRTWAAVADGLVAEEGAVGALADAAVHVGLGQAETSATIRSARRAVSRS